MQSRQMFQVAKLHKLGFGRIILFYCVVPQLDVSLWVEVSFLKKEMLLANCQSSGKGTSSVPWLSRKGAAVGLLMAFRLAGSGLRGSEMWNPLLLKRDSLLHMGMTGTNPEVMPRDATRRGQCSTRAWWCSLNPPTEKVWRQCGGAGEGENERKVELWGVTFSGS